jgi:hypothetical protein
MEMMDDRRLGDCSGGGIGGGYDRCVHRWPLSIWFRTGTRITLLFRHSEGNRHDTTGATNACRCHRTRLHSATAEVKMGD